MGVVLSVTHLGEKIAKGILLRILRNLEGHVEHHGRRMRSYALVVWDDRGAASVSFDVASGPISLDMLPDYLKTTLLSEIAIEEGALRALRRLSDGT